MTRPFYARALRLRHIRPGWLLCSLFFEGSVVVAALGALAELVTWWSILVIPLTVALLVKLDDLAAGHRHGASSQPRDAGSPQPAAPGPGPGQPVRVGARHRAPGTVRPARSGTRRVRLRGAVAALVAALSPRAADPGKSSSRHAGGAPAVGPTPGEQPGQGPAHEPGRVRGTAPAPGAQPPRPAGWVRGRAPVPGRRLIPPPRTTT